MAYTPGLAVVGMYAVANDAGAALSVGVAAWVIVPPPTGATVVRTNRTITGTAEAVTPLNVTPSSLRETRLFAAVIPTSKTTRAVAAPKLIPSDAAKY